MEIEPGYAFAQNSVARPTIGGTIAATDAMDLVLHLRDRYNAPTSRIDPKDFSGTVTRVCDSYWQVIKEPVPEQIICATEVSSILFYFILFIFIYFYFIVFFIL